MLAKGDFDWHRTFVQRLLIGITHDEINPFYTLSVHVVNSIAASSPNSNYFNDGIGFFGQIEIDELMVFHNLWVC
jgi:hypothetical protein